jgi:tartrate dehydratase beta subunit/fumarate hydratase class I family protein
MEEARRMVSLREGTSSGVKTMRRCSDNKNVGSAAPTATLRCDSTLGPARGGREAVRCIGQGGRYDRKQRISEGCLP